MYRKGKAKFLQSSQCFFFAKESKESLTSTLKLATKNVVLEPLRTQNTQFIKNNFASLCDKKLSLLTIFLIYLQDLSLILKKILSMKIIVPFLIILVATSVSCSSDTSKTESKTVKKTNIVVKTNTVKADKMLTVNIDGMVCEKGCGSSIRKELLHTKAIESCEFDFQTDRKTNTVKIAFDKDKITVDKIVAILNSMNEKQFKVIDTTTTAFESKNSSKSSSKIEENYNESSSTSSKDEAKIEMSDSTIDHDAPNLLQVFSRLITG